MANCWSAALARQALVKLVKGVPISIFSHCRDNICNVYLPDYTHQMAKVCMPDAFPGCIPNNVSV